MKNKKLIEQIIKFVIVGGIATIIDFSIFHILHNILNANVVYSNVIAFSISVIYNYIASVKWVFEVDEKKSKKKQLVFFFALSIIGLLINTIIVHLWVDILHFDSKIQSLFGKAIATGIVMVFNFVTRKIFLEKKSN